MKGLILGAKNLKNNLFFLRLARKNSSLESMKSAVLFLGSVWALKCFSIKLEISSSLLILLVKQ